MPIKVLGLGDGDPVRMSHAIRQLQEGRSSAHGTFSMSGVAVEVDAPTCTTQSHVSIMALNSEAATQMAGGMYVLPGKGVFAVTSNVSGNGSFSFGIVG